MNRLAAIAALLLLATTVQAEAAKSIYTKIDLKKCQQIKKPDGQIFEGAWRCAGYAGYDVFISAADSREMAAFGQSDKNNCSGTKTFNGFNTTGSTIEWRMMGPKPIAAIQRWTVSIDAADSSKHVTWLVVNKLVGGTSCQIHYVAGSFPKANEAARKAADQKAEGFNCEKDKPTYDSAIGPPGINLEACTAPAKQ